MKKSKLKFLALPLCLSLLLVGCGKADLPKQNEVEAGAGATSLLEVMPAPVYGAVDLGSLTTIGKGYVGAAQNTLLFKETDKDVMNNIVETHTLYDAKEGKTVLTLTHTYADGAYDDSTHTDEYDNEWKKPTEMDVSYEEVSDVWFLKVETTTNTRVSGDVLEKEEDSNGYVTTTHTDYYGLDGTKIGGFDAVITPEAVTVTSTRAKVLFGNIAAEIDVNTGKVYKTWNAEKEHLPACADYEGDGYYVYLDTSYGQNGACETYDKNGKLVNRYVYESALTQQAFVLNNGNVVVQYLNITEGVDYDIATGDIKVKVKTVIVDTLGGGATVKDFPYFIIMLETRAGLERISENEGTEIEFGEGVFNYVAALKTGKDESFDFESMTLLFTNSALEISYEMEALNSEMVMETEEFITKVDDNKYLIYVDGPTDAEYALINGNGTVLEYLPAGAEIIPNGFIVNGRVYNFDMECVLNFGNMGYTLERVVGDTLILLDYDWDGEPVLRCYKVSTSGGFYESESRWGATVYEGNDDYVILLDDGEYTLYDSDMSYVMKANDPMTVKKYGKGNYVVTAEIDGEIVCYSWKAVESGGDGK